MVELFSRCERTGEKQNVSSKVECFCCFHESDFSRRCRLKGAPSGTRTLAAGIKKKKVETTNQTQTQSKQKIIKHYAFRKIQSSECLLVPLHDACDPCARPMLIFSVSFQFYRMIPEENPHYSASNERPTSSSLRFPESGILLATSSTRCF